MASYRAVMMTRKGGPEVLETVELPLRDPEPGEARVRVRACGVGATDVTMRRGYYPFAPKIPFVQGYDVVGEVDAVGAGVTGVAPGDRVAALTVHGGYAEYLYRGADELVRVPDGLDDAELVALILNYATAYQMIHRVAQQRAGESALVTGANGGVGQALLELLRVHGVTAIGAAGKRAHELVRALGATPVEGREAPIDRGVLAIKPEGVDASYDALGGRFVAQCIRATRKGGWVVGYGFSGTDNSALGAARGFGALYVKARLLGRRSAFYGITARYRRDRAPFLEDLPKLMALLADHQIRPKIAARLPLLDARRANELQERGGVDGKIVLVRDAPAA
jgi:NADPH:quinone reductase-like Zn-dependent oxidoreductase